MLVVQFAAALRANALFNKSCNVGQREAKLGHAVLLWHKIRRLEGQLVELERHCSGGHNAKVAALRKDLGAAVRQREELLAEGRSLPRPSNRDIAQLLGIPPEQEGQVSTILKRARNGDMVDNILARIPKRRVEDVILFDLLDKRPVGFNIIQWDTPEERDLIIDELYLTLDRIYDMRMVGGPMFEANFRAMLKLLMGDGSKGREDFVPTLLDFISCYQNDGFRGWLKSTMSDRQVLEFVDELEKAGGECSLRNMSPYITSKFSRFMYDTTLKRIIGQGKTAFDFSDIMDSGKIFLVKLRKGRFGHVVGALLSNMLVSRFKLAAMKRGDVAIEQRRDFYLYVDEAHNLPQENFTELLSEARKYRLSLLLSTQFCSQLTDPSKRGSDLLSAITGNVGTSVIFRLGSEDAAQMARILEPYFSSRDIVGLPNWQGYVRMNLNQEPTPPFSFVTEKVAIPADDETASYIRELSSLKYGMDAAALDRFFLDKQRKLRGLASDS